MFKIEFPRTLTFPPSKREYETNDFVTFTQVWPTNLGIKPGMTYQIIWHQNVPYVLKYIIPVGDYKDVDLSDPSTYSATGPENLYPYGTNNTLYQILIGFKPGNYIVHPYMPQNQYILGLEYTNMSPTNDNMTNAKLKYVGGIRPGDSPYYDPRIKLVTVYNMLPFYLRFLALDGYSSNDEEKCIAPIIVNHCQLQEAPDATAEQKAKNVIRYVTEISFRTTQG